MGFVLWSWGVGSYMLVEVVSVMFVWFFLVVCCCSLCALGRRLLAFLIRQLSQISCKKVFKTAPQILEVALRVHNQKVVGGK